MRSIIICKTKIHFLGVGPDKAAEAPRLLPRGFPLLTVEAGGGGGGGGGGWSSSSEDELLPVASEVTLAETGSPELPDRTPEPELPSAPGRVVESFFFSNLRRICRKSSSDNTTKIERI